MRIVFCGTPEFAVPTLRGLLANPEFAVAAVVTQPDRPRGRGQRVSVSAVEEVAAGARGIFRPERAKSDGAYDFFAEVHAGAVGLIDYRQKHSRPLLEDSGPAVM